MSHICIDFCAASELVCAQSGDVYSRASSGRAALLGMQRQPCTARSPLIQLTLAQLTSHISSQHWWSLPDSFVTHLLSSPLWWKPGLIPTSRITARYRPALALVDRKTTYDHKRLRVSELKHVWTYVQQHG